MNQTLSMDQVFLNKVIAIIEANLSNDKFGAAELSRGLGISHSNINRKLRSLHKKTISQLIQEIRLQHAMEMLQEKVATASEIAFRVGFSSPAYFNKCFHDYFGFPPGEVKKLEEYDREKAKHQISSESSKEGFRVKTYILKQRKWLIIAFSALICVLGAGATLTIIRSINQTKDLAKLEKSIAVLPFINDSPDDQNAYFINGIMDEVLNNLQKIKGCRVLSRTSTEQFRINNRPSIPEIAKKLGVNFIVEGSGQKYGNKFVLRVQLIAAINENHLWGESYEREILETSDIISLQSQIAQTIASELKATITPEEKTLIESKFTTNLTAYDFFFRGEEEYRKFTSKYNNYQALKNAEDLYKKALEYDPSFARAYIGLAFVYHFKHFWYSFYKEKYLDSVLILANRALSYDDHLAQAYYTRATYYSNNGKIEEAIKEIDKALKYNPNFWYAYHWKAWNIFLYSYNHSDYIKAIEYEQKAISLNRGNDLPGLLRNLGTAYSWFAGFREKAEYYYNEAFKLDGDTLNYYSWTGSVDILYGDFEKGIELSRKAYEMDTNNINSVTALMYQYFNYSQYKEALKYARKAIKIYESLGQALGSEPVYVYLFWKNEYKNEAKYNLDEAKKFYLETIRLGRSLTNNVWSYYDLASLYAFEGEKEKAYEMLNIVVRSKIFPFLLIENIKKYNPLLDSIRNEPQFQQIVKEMEAKYLAEHERVRKWLVEKGEL
jgi:TolB-like protein/AraC-like DNA-binding protein